MVKESSTFLLNVSNKLYFRTLSERVFNILSKNLFYPTAILYNFYCPKSLGNRKNIFSWISAWQDLFMWSSWFKSNWQHTVLSYWPGFPLCMQNCFSVYSWPLAKLCCISSSFRTNNVWKTWLSNMKPFYLALLSLNSHGEVCPYTAVWIYK